MRPELVAVLARLAVKVARPQHREMLAKAEARRRGDVAALLTARGR